MPVSSCLWGHRDWDGRSQEDGGTASQFLRACLQCSWPYSSTRVLALKSLHRSDMIHDWRPGERHLLTPTLPKGHWRRLPRSRRGFVSLCGGCQRNWGSLGFHRAPLPTPEPFSHPHLPRSHPVPAARLLASLIGQQGKCHYLSIKRIQMVPERWKHLRNI